MKASALASLCAAVLLVSGCGSTDHRSKPSGPSKTAHEQVPAELASEWVPSLTQHVLGPGEFPLLAGSPVYTASAARWVELTEVTPSLRRSEIKRLEALDFIGGAREQFHATKKGRIGIKREGLLLVEEFSSPAHALSRLDYEYHRPPKLFAHVSRPEEFQLPGARGFWYDAHRHNEQSSVDAMFTRGRYFYLVGAAVANLTPDASVRVAAENLFYRNFRSSSPTPSLPADETVPKGSRLIDLAWIGSRDGWALLEAPCPDYEAPCTRIARTQSGGASWALLPNPPYPSPAEKPAPLGSARGRSSEEAEEQGGERGVDGLRFVTPSIGYLFGPSLLMTRDGGESWTPIASPPVDAIEPGPGGVLGIFASHHCSGLCAPELEMASPGSEQWQLLPAKLIADTEGKPRLIRVGDGAIYVVVPGGGMAFGYSRPELYRSLNDGRNWSEMTEPCSGRRPAQMRGEDVVGRHEMGSIAAAPGGFLAVICSTFNGHSHWLITSDDHGASWRSRRPINAPAHFHPGVIAAASRAKLVIAGGDEYASQLIFSSDGGQNWTTVASERIRETPSAEPIGVAGYGRSETFELSHLGFEDSQVGHWITPHAIWTTTDGGARWTRRPFP